MQNIQKFDPESLKLHKQVVIYGAGEVAKFLINRIYDCFGFEKISCIMVTKEEGNPCHILGKAVIGMDNPDAAQNLPADLPVIVATLEKTQPEILQTLSTLPFETIYTMTDLCYLAYQEQSMWESMKPTGAAQADPEQTYFYRCLIPCAQVIEECGHRAGWEKVAIRREISDLSGEGMRISRLVVELGTKCSLRCKECNNLMPHYRKHRELDADQIIASLGRILQWTDALYICELIGGEPFLMENLGKVLAAVLREDKIRGVEITTNATILPKEETIPLLQNEKVLVRISDYGQTVDKEKMLSFLETHHIRYTLLELGNWISPGGVHKRNKTKETLQAEYSRCSSGYVCKTLFEDKVFACARAASLYDLGYMKEKEFLRVDDHLDTAALRQFWMQDYAIACDYCDIAAAQPQYVKPGEQVGND